MGFFIFPMHTPAPTRDSSPRKRQWGTEKTMTPLSILHARPTIATVTLSRLAILVTIFFWLSYIFSIILRQLFNSPQSYEFTMEAFSYTLVVSLLAFSSLIYLVARHGALERFRKHKRIARAVLDSFFTEKQPSVTVVIPSYSEEYSVIRQTILSAALQEYPHLRVVLLIDDDPNTTNPTDRGRLELTRRISEEVSQLLRTPHNRFVQALRQFEKSRTKRRAVTVQDVACLADEYAWAASWLTEFARTESKQDHVDTFFIEQVIAGLASDLQLVHDALQMSIREQAPISKQKITQLYQRLVWTFQVEVNSFERKKYLSLSHEANKAMNLNTYIGLMGGTYLPEQTPEGTILTSTHKQNRNGIHIPDSDYIITLDADSMLLREYCLRLVYFLEQPVNARVAVTQTPYSSFRGAASRIERLAGATTDIQHILHQGMSYYGATFWVGANAVIRKKALNDLLEIEYVDGYEIKRYIKDRTVIEDTESSIDLGIHGWKLVNYPERLSYSATPPDFGSLIIQRRRWANGGLLILPKLLNQIRARKQRHELVSRTEIALRINYMASIAWATFGLLFLLAYPYDGRLLSPLVILAALPYFMAMASDLKYCGYRYVDILNIYGFNLIMLPVNLAGVLKSIEQALTGEKIPFARTPKVKNRTRASFIYVVVPLFVIGFSLFTAWRNVYLANWGNALFAGVNATLAFWALMAYIGPLHVLADSVFAVVDWIYVDATPQSKKQSHTAPSLDWKGILHHGTMNEKSVMTSRYRKGLL